MVKEIKKKKSKVLSVSESYEILLLKVVELIQYTGRFTQSVAYAILVILILQLIIFFKLI